MKTRTLFSLWWLVAAVAAVGPETWLLAGERQPDLAATRRKLIQDSLGKGDRLLVYLDCGAQAQSVGPSLARLRQVNGASYTFPGSERAAPRSCGTVACGSQALEFAAFGLKPKKKHLLGFSWWDFEGAKRVQHVQVEGASPTNAQLLVPPTLLPSFEGRQQGPVSMVLPLAPDACVSGKLRICVVKDQGTNAVLSELWLIESDSGMVGPPPEKPPQARILLVTGNDYPGHAWRQTAPALAEQIRQDKRLQVSVVEDPEFLANPAVFGFDAMVMHWMNWESPSPGPTARENLSQYVASGRGLVLVHFACGAFQDWPEFAKLAGRVYDAKLPPHDARGPFEVKLTTVAHPVTAGLKSFQADDELYTCLGGNLPIEVLATARSKVTAQDHPMAFALNYEKGRVFHSPLGHDVKALTIPEVSELFRRAAAWTAGLAPTGAE